MTAHRSSARRTHPRLAAALLFATSFLAAIVAAAQDAPAREPAAPQTVSAEQLQSAIDNLGKLDYAARVDGARTIRRTPADQAVPALLHAVAAHDDGYVRFRALVLLVGFNDPRTKAAMREALISRNDRLRAVAYGYFEHNADPAMVAQLLSLLDQEDSEFVRPALVRALAALGADARVRPTLTREAGRGEDFFRSAVIEALGDYKADYAFDAIVKISQQDGPLVDDAAIALGKIGGQRAYELLVGLQQTAPREAQPYVAAAICLAGVNCEKHEGYLAETLKFSQETPGFQPLLRGAAYALGDLGVAGRASAVTVLFDVGVRSSDPARAPIALALGTVAMRNPATMLTVLEHYPDRPVALALLAEGFDMLEEDLEKERFFALVRRTYWNAPDGSPTRALAQSLIGKLDF